jgi:hypothetical protein
MSPSFVCSFPIYLLRFASPILHLLLLVCLTLLLSAASAQRNCDLSDLITDKADDYAPSCSAVTANGARCRVDPTACTSEHKIMVEESLCVDGLWLWPDTPEFCEVWGDCVFTPPYELRCQSRQPPRDFPSRLPERLDPRLKVISATFYKITKHIPTTFLPNIEHLNLSHNEITELMPLGLQQTTLRVLDLSENSITSVNSVDLPTAGRLDELYLQGNPIQGYSVLAMVAAMSRCLDVPVEEEDQAIASTGMVLEAPGCRLRVASGHTPGESPGFVQCITLDCNADVQDNIEGECKTAGSYSLPNRCDTIHDCPDSSDEANCQDDVHLTGFRESSGDVGLSNFCRAFGGYIEPRYDLRYGLATFPLTPDGRIIFPGVQNLVLPLGMAQVAFTFTFDDPGRFVQSLAARGSFADETFEFYINYTIITLPDVLLSCTLLYSLGRGPSTATKDTTADPVTTPFSGMVEPAREGSGGLPLVPVVAGCLAALLLCLSLGFVLWRKRRAYFHSLRLDNLAPRTPKHVLESVGSQERSSWAHHRLCSRHALP